MASVIIHSGVDPKYRLEFVPQDKWAHLVDARRSFIIAEFTNDCRKLVEWVNDAKKMWQPLGYASADDLVANGYGLEPERVRIAVRWLELHNPDKPIGYQDVLSMVENSSPIGAHGTNRFSGGRPSLRRSTYGYTMEYIISRLKRDAANPLASNYKKAREALEKIRSGEIRSARQAGIYAGIVKVPTAVVQVRRIVAKAEDNELEEIMIVVLDEIKRRKKAK